MNPSLALVQPRKTSPYITERLLMGRKESNQAKRDMVECLPVDPATWVRFPAGTG